MGRSIEEFEIFTTSDGSPSLCIANSTGYTEKMHHSAGALSESIYIYYAALEAATQRQWPIRALSLGLGLGYNEILVAAHAVKRNGSAVLYSFEIEPALIKSFLDWVHNEPAHLAPLYDSILAGAKKNIYGWE